MRTPSIFFFISFVLAFGSAAAQPPSGSVPARAQSPVNVLYIGNSYTYSHELPSRVSAMARSEGSRRLIQDKVVVIPGATLQQHWESGVAQRAIRERKWDYVVLQEQSLLPIEDKERMFKYARLFGGEIKRNGAKTIFFLTWARRARPETQVQLNAAYTSIARELAAVVAPVGPAWQLAQEGSAELILHEEDGSHPTITGSHLSACVIYLTIQASETHCPVPQDEVLTSRAATALQAAATAALSGQPR